MDDFLDDIVVIEKLIFEHGAAQRLVANYRRQVEETNDLTEEQASHLLELEERLRRSFWSIVEKSAQLLSVRGKT